MSFSPCFICKRETDECRSRVTIGTPDYTANESYLNICRKCSCVFVDQMLAECNTASFQEISNGSVDWSQWRSMVSWVHNVDSVFGELKSVRIHASSIETIEDILLTAALN